MQCELQKTVVNWTESRFPTAHSLSLLILFISIDYFIVSVNLGSNIMLQVTRNEQYYQLYVCIQAEGKFCYFVMKFGICSVITKVWYKRILRTSDHVTVTATAVG